ncbi:hypothetical protein L596_001990 [Steinernema carpocapsae]|uniref:Uncharacterized protein n=1 Tax=Steinernema carpocapsae TaxID=34508 RepID=A0A4U8UNC5_STECR|nr:hypothetical protein L596_001990 [Steinernema carpocapsae]
MHATASEKEKKHVLRKFCSVLIHDPGTIPLCEIEEVELVKGEAAMLMAKFISIIDCNRRAMGSRYMEVIRQIHETTPPDAKKAERRTAVVSRLA